MITIKDLFRDMVPLEKVGQIKSGDNVIVGSGSGLYGYTVQDVLFPGEPHEEILLSVKENLYFIVSMALDGTSWAKKVMVKPNNLGG